MSDLPGQPNLSQLLETVLEAAGEEIAVARPGVITGVSSDRKTADVQPAVRRHDSADADPVLPDVPLFFPAGCSWPVDSGTPCLLIFADRALEEWQSKGGDGEVEPADPRTHDLTDGMAIPMGPGGARSGREDDISLSIDDTLASSVELRLQSDGKIALGNSSKSGTYKDHSSNDQNWGPTACELVALLVDLLAVLLTKPLVLYPGHLGVTDTNYDLLAEIKAKLESIKGAL